MTDEFPMLGNSRFGDCIPRPESHDFLTSTSIEEVRMPLVWPPRHWATLSQDDMDRIKADYLALTGNDLPEVG